MTRRRRKPESSLELFLDTICNTFGGIVFITILLSVILQQRTRATNAEPSQGLVTPSEAKRIDNLAASLRASLDQYSALMQELEPLQPTQQDDELDELLKSQKAKEQLLKASSEACADAAGKLHELTEENRRSAENIASAEAAAKQVEAELSKQEQELRRKIDEKAQTLHLPKQEATWKRQVTLLVFGGKVYPLRNLDGELATEHLQILDPSPKHLKILPRPSCGWDLSVPIDAQQFTSFMQDYSSRQHFFTVFVWSNGFAAFQSLKDWLIRRGFDYQLDPLAEDGPVTLVPSISPGKVQ